MSLNKEQVGQLYVVVVILISLFFTFVHAQIFTFSHVQFYVISIFVIELSTIFFLRISLMLRLG